MSTAKTTMGPHSALSSTGFVRPTLATQSSFGHASGTTSDPLSSLSTSTPLVDSSTQAGTDTLITPSVLPTSIPTSGCERRSNLTLSFDDLLAKSSPNRTVVGERPIPYRYSGLHFSPGFSYISSTQTSFMPASYPNLAVFRPNASTSLNNTTGTILKPGEIGIGQRGAQAGLRFDAYQAHLGCGSVNNQSCAVTLTGYTWNAANFSVAAAFSYNTTLPSCVATRGCSLKKVVFPPQFRRLTGLQVQMHQANNTRVQYPFYMDNLILSWWDGSCESSASANMSQAV